MKLLFSAALAALVFTVSAEAAISTTTRSWQFNDDSAGGLRIDNLVGDVVIERGTAAGFGVSVTVTAEAGSAAEADTIARAVEFRARDAGSSSSFQVAFPEEQFPALYVAGAPTGWWVGSARTEYLGQKRRITADKDEGVQVRVDIVVRAPADAKLDVHSYFGAAAADGFSGELKLDSASGRLSARSGSGRAELDSGSGAVEVSNYAGVVRVDTGSGAVTVSGCQCKVDADAGSGTIRIHGGEGELQADTGSGAVTVEDFRGSLSADTGSGSVTARALSLAEHLDIDTGSGSVHVEGDLSSLKRLDIDTGSGRVSIGASAWPPMEILINTGSGSTNFDVPGAEVIRDADGSTLLRLGAGDGRGKIKTGSGGVRMYSTPVIAN